MTVRLTEVVSFLNTTLDIGKFRDYCPNGLQVEGSPEVDRVVTAVSATAEVMERALAMDADLLVVHHGVIWGDGIKRVTGAMGRRLQLLLSNSISLAAYHLPLDAHDRLGNNVGLADAIGLQANRQPFGEVRGNPIGLVGTWPSALSIEEACQRISGGVNRGDPVRFCFPHGPKNIKTVGLCTGAAGNLIEDAVHEGCDLYVTGELSESTGNLAKELQINLICAGHYDTEVFGAQRLVDELRMKFADITVDFVDCRTPV